MAETVAGLSGTLGRSIAVLSFDEDYKKVGCQEPMGRMKLGGGHQGCRLGVFVEFYEHTVSHSSILQTVGCLIPGTYMSRVK